MPDVVGKNRFEAEKILEEADLKFRIRALRPAIKRNPTQCCFNCREPEKL